MRKLFTNDFFGKYSTSRTLILCYHVFRFRDGNVLDTNSAGKSKRPTQEEESITWEDLPKGDLSHPNIRHSRMYIGILGIGRFTKDYSSCVNTRNPLVCFDLTSYHETIMVGRRCVDKTYLLPGERFYQVKGFPP